MISCNVKIYFLSPGDFYKMILLIYLIASRYKSFFRDGWNLLTDSHQLLYYLHNWNPNNQGIVLQMKYFMNPIIERITVIKDFL